MMNCVSFCSSISISIPTPIAATQQHLAFSSSSSLCSISRVSINPPRRRRINNNGFTCNALFGLGVPELVVIAGVAAIVFGPKKLPEVGRSIGKTVKSFQQTKWRIPFETRTQLESHGFEPE
ncbi:twin arginine translocase [Medicago truncatula]|uniref:Twin arginine translocase n=1 Tax=Medicago truncatula TaxID=3880 RepID=A0A072U483_MEDTR|nr:twin arginine translocase [Medicago truncatula]